ncbi:hypothetical protein [Galbibacter sp. BG1]
MKRKKKQVKYLYFDYKNKQDGIYKPQWLTKTVEAGYSKRYMNTILLLLKLSKPSMILIHFLVEQMDERNYVANHGFIKDKFNELLSSLDQKPYADNTINKCFSELTKNNILLKPLKKPRGVYQVNPEYFFNGTEEERVKCIRAYLEDRNRYQVDKHRREEYLKEAKTTNLQDPDQESSSIEHSSS